MSRSLRVFMSDTEAIRERVLKLKAGSPAFCAFLLDMFGESGLNGMVASLAANSEEAV
jgi:hypothetical protein